MEGSAYVEATIRLYERLRAVQPRTGICLQAYLKRTAADIERLRPLDPAIRLVKGAYDEPASIAYRDKRQVDANYLALAVDFLKTGRGRPIRLGLGTHDVALDRADRRAGRPGRRRARRVRGRDAVRDPDRGSSIRLAKAGYRVQTLIAYGDAWYPWYMRRLAERPANVDLRDPLAAAVTQEEVPAMSVIVSPARRGPDEHDRDRERVRGQRPRPRAGGRGQADHPPADRRARFRHARARPRGGQARARRGRDPLRAVPRHPGAARGDRRGRRPAQGRHRPTRRRCSSRSAARA